MDVGHSEEKETRKEIERSIKRDVAKMKRRLMRQAKKRGIWENFGQKEFRDLDNKYGYYTCDRDVDTQPIFDFREWCEGYDGKDERYL
jgi:hypothetical protein